MLSFMSAESIEFAPVILLPSFQITWSNKTDSPSVISRMYQTSASKQIELSKVKNQSLLIQLSKIQQKPQFYRHQFHDTLAEVIAVRIYWLQRYRNLLRNDHMLWCNYQTKLNHESSMHVQSTIGSNRSFVGMYYGTVRIRYTYYFF